jgi:predicted metal-dependent HD superfamily phosphohydrolase
MSSSDLRPRWPDAGGEAAFADLVARYGEPHRHYHTLDHVRAVLDSLPGAGLALSFAAWYHDAIYDTRSDDNEERSAALMRSTLRVPIEDLDGAARLILLTKTHQTTPADAKGLALLDADLAILSAGETIYDEYAAAIRREYDWVPEEAYRRGRAGVLRRFLERERIYHTVRMRGREDVARGNLRRELERLGS